MFHTIKVIGERVLMFKTDTQNLPVICRFISLYIERVFDLKNQSKLKFLPIDSVYESFDTHTRNKFGFFPRFDLK